MYHLVHFNYTTFSENVNRDKQKKEKILWKYTGFSERMLSRSGHPVIEPVIKKHNNRDGNFRQRQHQIPRMHDITSMSGTLELIAAKNKITVLPRAKSTDKTNYTQQHSGTTVPTSAHLLRRSTQQTGFKVRSERQGEKFPSGKSVALECYYTATCSLLQVAKNQDGVCIGIFHSNFLLYGRDSFLNNLGGLSSFFAMS